MSAWGPAFGEAWGGAFGPSDAPVVIDVDPFDGERRIERHRQARDGLRASVVAAVETHAPTKAAIVPSVKQEPARRQPLPKAAPEVFTASDEEMLMVCLL